MNTVKRNRLSKKRLTYIHVHNIMYAMMEGFVQISLTRFRKEMFSLLSNLRGGERLTLTHDGKDAYVIEKVADRNTRFKEGLKRCPKLQITNDQVLAFKNEGRR